MVLAHRLRCDVLHVGLVSGTKASVLLQLNAVRCSPARLRSALRRDGWCRVPQVASHENQTLNSMAEGVATSGFPRTTLRSSALVVDTVAMAAAGAFRVVLHVVRKAPRLLHANSGKTFIAEVERLQILREVWQAKGAPHFFVSVFLLFVVFLVVVPTGREQKTERDGRKK